MFLILITFALIGSPSALSINDWKNHEKNVLSKLYKGCYNDKNPRDLPYLVHSSGADMSVPLCIRECRQQGFKLAGLQNAVNCYCGNNQVRRYDKTSTCNKACPADSSYTCGGTSSSDVYHVSSNDHYIGCYNDSVTQRDLPFRQWDNDSGKSAEDCMHACALGNFRYAGVQRGGACYCGREYGRHGGADEKSCNVRCNGWAKQNCGGNEANAIYRTEMGGKLSGGADPFSSSLWDSTGQVSGIPTTLFTLYPALRTVLTKRLIIQTSSPVLSPIEDKECSDNCYKDCGEIFLDDSVSSLGKDHKLRFFYIKLSDIKKHVSSSTKRVFLYAQTLVIDESANLNFSLFIRARQIFIDRSRAMAIDVDPTSPAFDINLEKQLFNDIGPDFMHQKMSYTCSKILHDTQQVRKKAVAYGILSDIASTKSSVSEVSSFVTSVRGYLGSLSGVIRSNVHFVPFLTKSRLAEVLKTYYTEINIYRRNYDKLNEAKDNKVAFLTYAQAMASTYTTTDVAEAKSAHDSAMTAVHRANETYQRFRWYYNNSRSDLDKLKKEFEAGLKEHKGWNIARAVFKFITGIGGIVVGAINFDKDDLSGSVSPIIDDINGLFDTMYNLADTVRQIDEISSIADRIVEDLERIDGDQGYLRYIDDLELTVQLNVNVIKWRNMKNYGTSVLSDPKILRVRGAANYHRQLLDVCNWGEALTKAMIEQAELLRGAVKTKSIMAAKVCQQSRVEGHIKDTKNNIIKKTDVVLADINEQMYDVRMDLNEALVTFCQAYFYENMFECRESYKPKFGGSLTDLLIKINAASLDNILVGTAPSTVERELTVRDVTPGRCIDHLQCPLENLRKTGMLVFEVPTSHPSLIDLDAYKVAELRLNFTGVKTRNQQNPWLKVRIESSGQFNSRAGGKIRQFLTRPTTVSFEYNIMTNHISLYANIDAPFMNLVQRITPFTKWVMHVSPSRSADIDFSDVTSVNVRFRGSAIDNESFRRRLHDVYPEIKME